MIDFIFWYLLISIIGWITFPIAYRFFSFLPDRGFALSRVFGLLLWGYGFWLLASCHILENNTGGVLLVSFLLAGISLSILRGSKKEEFFGWIKHNRSTILMAEIVFLIAFTFWTVVRATGPDIYGTEKPMELAFINAILRSPAFPPMDPWLSGYSISYYYFGYVLIAMITQVTGTSSAVAFNLAVALIFGLAAVSAYGLILNLVELYFFKARRQKNNLQAAGEPAKPPSLSTLFWSLLGPIYLLLVSNIEGFLEMLHARGIFWNLNSSGSYESSFWNWLNIQEIINPPSLPFSWTPHRAAGGSWWWRASRVLQDFDIVGNSKEIIDEFPMFSFLLADLHAHVIAIPFILLAIAVSLHYLVATRQEEPYNYDLITWLIYWLSGERKPFSSLMIYHRFRSGNFWLIALVFGALAFLNIWDLPVQLALFACVVTILRVRSYGWSIYRVFEFIESVIVFGLAGFCLYLPFYLGFASQAGGISPSMIYATRGVFFWVMFAPLLIPILAWLLWNSTVKGIVHSWKNGVGLSALIVFGLLLVSLLMGFLVLQMEKTRLETGPNAYAVYASLLGGFQENLPIDFIKEAVSRRLQQPGTWITLFIMLVPVLSILTSQSEMGKNRGEKNQPSHISDEDGKLSRDEANIFTVLLVFLGIGLVLFPENFYLRDQFGWRMNTIFKFYYQAWILWSISAAFATIILFHRLRNIPRFVFAFAWMAVFLMSLAYPLFGIISKTNGFNPSEWTLDGSKFISRSSPDEMDAIHWLQEAPLGIIVEAVGGSYTSYARVSTFSGQPTVLGWPGHESQWRGGAQEMGSREEDIQKIYMSQSWQETKELIDEYDIRYIYIGELEKSKYRVNETKFSNNLRSVFTSTSVVIYEVPGWTQ